MRLSATKLGSIANSRSFGDQLADLAGQVPGLDLNFARNKSLIDDYSGTSLVTFTRASTGTYVGSDGLIKTATTNEARFDHNPTTGESLGLLVEEARTNLLLQSESIDNGTNWNRVVAGTGSTPIVNANSVVAPDGTTTADQVILALNGGTTINDSSYITQSYSSTSGTTYVVSIWLRTASGNVTIFLDADSQNTNTITVTPVWQRLSFARTTSSTASRTVRFGLRGTFGTADSATFYAWGAQMEAGAFATSYIPTTTATATRAADVASITGTNFSSWYNQTEGTVFGEYFPSAVAPATTSQTLIYISNNTSTDRNNINKRANADQSTRWASAKTAATDTAFINAGTWLAANTKIAAVYKNNDYAASLNGAASVVDTAVDLFTGMTQANIGTNQANLESLNGTIKRITYWPVRLANPTLQSITTQ